MFSSLGAASMEKHINFSLRIKSMFRLKLLLSKCLMLMALMTLAIDRPRAQTINQPL